MEKLETILLSVSLGANVGLITYYLLDRLTPYLNKVQESLDIVKKDFEKINKYLPFKDKSVLDSTNL